MSKCPKCGAEVKIITGLGWFGDHLVDPMPLTITNPDGEIYMSKTRGTRNSNLYEVHKCSQEAADGD